MWPLSGTMPAQLLRARAGELCVAAGVGAAGVEGVGAVGGGGNGGRELRAGVAAAVGGGEACALGAAVGEGSTDEVGVSAAVGQGEDGAGVGAALVAAVAEGRAGARGEASCEGSTGASTGAGAESGARWSAIAANAGCCSSPLPSASRPPRLRVASYPSSSSREKARLKRHAVPLGSRNMPKGSHGNCDGVQRSLARGV